MYIYQVGPEPVSVCMQCMPQSSLLALFFQMVAETERYIHRSIYL